MFASSMYAPCKEGKSTVDTEKSTWRRLLMEFEEEGHTDLNINGHSHDKKGGVDEGLAPSFRFNIDTALCCNIPLL